MTHALFEQRIRRRESIKALKNRTLPPLPEGVHSPGALPIGLQEEVTDSSPVQAFKDELNQIEALKQQHLAKPKLKGGGFLKFSNFIVIFLFLLGSGLFFIGGYIYSYTNPMPGMSVTTVSTPPSNDGWGIPETYATIPVQSSQVPEGYMERKQYLEDQQSHVDSLVASGMNRSEAVLRSETNRFAANAATGLIARVRKVVGEGLGNVFAPLANTIIKGTVGTAVNKNSTAANAKDNPQSNSQTPGESSDSALTSSSSAQASAAQSTRDANAATGPLLTPSSAAATSSPAENTLFALELRTFRDRTDAFMFMRNLKAQGYKTAYTVKSMQGGNIVFTVRVGNFSNYMDAAKNRKFLDIPSRVVIVLPHDELMRY